MRKNIIPPPPVASAPAQPASALQSGISRPTFQQRTQRSSPASKQIAPLDAAFLSRTFRTTAWFGTILTLCAWSITRSAEAALSFGVGAATGAILLKSQQMFVRRLIRAKDAPPYQGWDALMPLWLLIPFKYTLLIAGLYIMFRSGVMRPEAFAIGFVTVQIVIFAKVIGRLFSARSIKEVYVSKGRTHIA